MSRDFMKAYSTESRFVIISHTILFAGASVNLFSPEFYRLGK